MVCVVNFRQLLWFQACVVSRQAFLIPPRNPSNLEVSAMASAALISYGPLMATIWPLVVCAQIACVIHVLRTGRPYWWIWILLVLPLIGIAAYLYLEVRPALGQHWLQNLLWKLKTSSQRIDILESQLAESTTVRNRLSLADELHDAAHFDRECEVLSEGLRGAFKDDATLLMRLAEAHLEAGRSNQAAEIIAKTAPEKSPDSQLQYALLNARLASRQNRPDAEQCFRELLSKKRSEAPRYYYAEHLLAHGRRGEATDILQDVLYQYRRGTVVWRYQEQKWYRAAKQLLRASPGRSIETVAAAALSATPGPN
jgi:hypothetical protein